ncbi:MAG: hypothetical protein GYA36_12450 [Veillonellaceae bacterium]|nr:hypothetical protein [Veillonellaceae bacterium]
MEMLILKDMMLNLSAGPAFPQQTINEVGSAKTFEKSATTSNAFSQKLSTAIDKSAKEAPITSKRPEKTKTASANKDFPVDTTPPGTAIGLAASLPPTEIPTGSDGGTGLETVTPVVSGILSDTSAELVAVATVNWPNSETNPMAVQQQAAMTEVIPTIPVVETGQRNSAIGTATTGVPTTIVETGQRNSAIGTATIGVPTTVAEKGRTSSTINATENPLRTGPQPSAFPPNISNGSFSATQQPVSQGTEHSATSAGNAAGRLTTANKTADMALNVDLKPLDPPLPRNIVSVQVTTNPIAIAADTESPLSSHATQLEQLPTQSGTPAIRPQIVAATEQRIPINTEPAEENPTNVVNNLKFEAKPEQVATPRAEQDTADDNLEQESEDSMGRTTKDKSQVVTVPLAPFEKVLNPIGAAPAAEPTLQQPRQELHEVARQVMDGMIASTDRLKSSQVIITLKPEHLGEVTVKINVDGDRVTAAFHAASSEVRAILESSLPQLRQEMSQQGWKFDSEGVYGGMQQFLANQQQQQSTNQWQMFSPIPQRMNRDEYDETIAFSPTGRLQVLSAAAVDYRV